MFLIALAASQAYAQTTSAGLDTPVPTGTNPEIDMPFAIGDVLKMELTSTGLGIGTASPMEKLHIYGTQASPAIGSANAGLARFQESGGANGIDVGYYYVGGQSPYGWLQSEYTGNIAAYYALNLNPLGGNIGVGTTSPASQLTISGTGQATDSFNTAGVLTGALEIDDTGSAVGNGGTLIFSAGSQAWKFAAIKGYVINGGGNSQGDIVFQTRPSATNSTLTDVMHITALGNVGISNNAPQYTLDIGGTLHTTGNITVGTNGGASTYLTVNGPIQAVNATLYDNVTIAAYQGYYGGNLSLSSGSVEAYGYYLLSDVNLKKDIRPIDHALDKLLEIKGVSFNWKKDGRSDMGVIAQNVAEVFPDIVTKNQDGLMSVEYSNLIGPMIESIRELKAENDDLRQKVSDMEDMKAELSQIRADIKDIQSDKAQIHSIKNEQYQAKEKVLLIK
jgi:hypothetical protein